MIKMCIFSKMSEGKVQITQTSDIDHSVWTTKKSSWTHWFWPLTKETEFTKDQDRLNSKVTISFKILKVYET